MPEFEKMLKRAGHPAHQVLVLDYRQRTASPVRRPNARSAKTVEAQSDGSRVAAPLGRDYTRAKETMLARTHIPEAPWWVVQADDKKSARLNCIDHLLRQVPYQAIEHATLDLPERVPQPGLHPPPGAR